MSSSSSSSPACGSACTCAAAAAANGGGGAKDNTPPLKQARRAKQGKGAWVTVSPLPVVEGTGLRVQEPDVCDAPVPRGAYDTKLQLKPPNAARTGDRKRRGGMFKRVSDEAGADFDHDYLDTEAFPKCELKDCKCDCCATFKQASEPDKLAYLRRIRDIARNKQETGGAGLFNEFLSGLIVTKPDVASRVDGLRVYNRNEYRLPPMIDGGKELIVSRGFWKKVWVISNNLLGRLSSCKRSTVWVPPEFRGGNAPRLEEQLKVVKEILEANLEVAEDHYVHFVTKKNKLRLIQGVVWADVWKKATAQLNPDFVEQAKRAGYWTGYDKRNRRPGGATAEGRAAWYRNDMETNMTPEQREKYAQYGGRVPVPISYTAVRDYVDKYLVRKKAQQVDVCQRCLTIEAKLKDKRLPEQERNKLRAELEQHKMEANTQYGFRGGDHTYAVGSKFSLTMDLDPAGNMRTPFVPNPEAYYLSICSMYNIVIASSHSVHYYGYDKRTAGKGANEIASIFWKHLKTEHARMKAEGGGLQELTVWCDSTRSQTWNGILMRFISDLVTPDSPFHIPGLKTVHLKCCLMGCVPATHEPAHARTHATHECTRPNKENI